MSRLATWYQRLGINGAPIHHLYDVSTRDRVCRDLLDLCDRMDKLSHKMDRDAAAIVRRSNEVDEMKRNVQRLVEMQGQSK